MPRISPGNSRLHQCLLLLFVIAAGTQALFTIDVFRYVTGDYALSPVQFFNWPAVSTVTYRPQGADIRTGDRLLAVNGRPVSRRADFAAVMRAARPGDMLRLSFERAGAVAEVPIRLRAVAPHPNALMWGFAAVSWIGMPWLCIVLGFWVAAQRPRDTRAWLLLGVLLGISQINRPEILDPLGWPLPLGLAAFLYRNLAALAWPACMLLFGFYFPQRWRLDRRAPRFKWLLLVPLLLLGVWSIASDLYASLRSGPPALPPLPLLGNLFAIFVICTISFFFIALGDKYRDRALAADDRRRLRMLYFGCTLALTPSFLLFIYTAVFRHRAPGEGDNLWLMFSIMAMALFPVTMAYVIVVQRAMDVRMVIRQGVQYALAQRGVLVIQICLIVAVVSASATLVDTAKLPLAGKLALIAAAILVVLRIRRGSERLRVWLDRRFFREAYNSDQILSELGENVRSILDSGALLETVARRISESLHVERVAVLLQQNGIFRPALALGYPAMPDFSIPAGYPAIDALRRKRAPLAVGNDPASPELSRLQSQLLLPLASRKELLGFISLGPKRSEEPYSPSDTTLLRTVAAQTGLALENARLSEAIAVEVAHRELLHREIEIAREVQQRLFPQTLPEIPALQYAGYCRPAQEVGGDYYDFLALSSGRLGIAIGDVSGKGVPAALLMASLQASVRGQSQSDTSRVSDLMTNVNRLVCDVSPENRYATFFYARFDPATRRLVYANGGHNAPMLLRGETLLRLENGGPPVGLFRLSQYQQEEVQLYSGDLLIFYTDGISEAENPAQEEWGEDALIAAVRAAEGQLPAALIGRIMQSADAFAAGAPQHDDMTLVVARVL
jgi:sigma-B regulation protein RsbU (phosphoserine phosphatase)